ncbi:MAG: hypothetical protein HYY65_08960 [Candidatus Tectomicrobia bacterium]|uniref:Uncharacterized protein n=1 Tax=Tectimicrobiota bacterium TaxID=2528274 RepID=A0A932GQE1_UNCTE|nr:hypothetical protein [Candidatus Tectomicrobia bacterium]
MRRRKLVTQRPMVQRNDLIGLGKEKLAELLAEQISSLPYHRQKQWVRSHLPDRAKDTSASESRRASLFDEIEEFCAQSRSGSFVSWEDDYGWDDRYGESGDHEKFEEWIELFTDLMKGALELTRSGRHTEAAEAYRKLLGLLKEAGQTTDILGNHGAPQDSIDLDFSKVIEAYARSLLASPSGQSVDEVITEVLPVAKKYRYVEGFTGLAGALDVQGRERLKERLSRAVEEGLKADRPYCPDEVEGLIALARVGKNQTEVLALKERFASRNAVYLREVLSHYERKKDWNGVARLAQMGVKHFGHHGEFAKALIKAREALGDPSAAQEAQIAHFLQEPGAAEFAALRRRSEALSNWDAVFEKLLRASASWLKTQLLLAEGKEREVLEGAVGRQSRMDLDGIKLVAKYAVARLSEGVDLAGFKKLEELQKRLTRDKDESYDWLRLIFQKPGTLTRGEYASLAGGMYRRLVDVHLNSGKSSRAAPAAHYCAIVAELSRLLDEPGLWADLLGHLKQLHGKKRLIWEKLKAEGCPLA